MYESFYGLTQKPFDLNPDPDYLYMSPGHEDVYTHLRYSLQESKGFVVVTGEIGSGKTTLINFLLRGIPQDVEVGILKNTSMPPSQFLKLICQEFELPVEGRDKPAMLAVFNRYLVDQYAAKRRVVLIVDEAQNLPIGTFEEIRMLSNLEAETHHVLQIVLVGQPELRRKLRQRGLEQLVQRVEVHCHLAGLTLEELGRYVCHRLMVAGAKNPAVFDTGALEAVYRHSRGIPRLINILCDTALVFGFGEENRTIDEALIEEVVEARRAGGLFEVVAPEENFGAPSADPLEQRISECDRRVRSLEPRVRAVEGMEGKIRTLEGMVETLRKEVETLWDPDHRLLEACKILKRVLGRGAVQDSGTGRAAGRREPTPQASPSSAQVVIGRFGPRGPHERHSSVSANPTWTPVTRFCTSDKLGEEDRDPEREGRSSDPAQARPSTDGSGGKRDAPVGEERSPGSDKRSG